MAKRCRACGGVFNRIQEDGTRYFHRCPPRIRVRVRQPDGSTNLKDLDQLTDTDAIEVTRADGKTAFLTKAERMPDDVRVDRHIERPNRVDENVVATGDAQGQPRATGAGVDDVPDA